MLDGELMLRPNKTMTIILINVTTVVNPKEI